MPFLLSSFTQYYWITLSRIVQNSSLLAKSLGLISVPVWLIILSDQLLIEALVSHYLTNKLIRRELILRRNSFHLSAYGVLAVVSNRYPPPEGRFPRVTHPSATNPKVRSTCMC